jgi:pimeloyl-ACP methyl ester carboxylesterase
MKRIFKLLGIALGVLLLLVIILPLVIPVPTLNTKPAIDMADPDSLFMDINGIQVHYKEKGSGDPAIILLHGFGASLFSWREVMDPLSSLGTVYAYDRPGFGLTSRPLNGAWTGSNPYSLRGQTQMLEDFMDQKGIDQAILVGNSAGGSVATLFSLEHPDRVAALVEVDAAVMGMGGNGTPGWQRYLLNTPQAQKLVPLLMRSIRNWGTEMIKTAWHDPGKISAGVVEGYQKPLQVDDWDKGLYEVLKARESIDLESKLNDLKLPVLVITGDDDRIVPTADSIQLADAIPGAKLVVLSKCGHVPQEECPADFLQAIEPFIIDQKK